MWEDWRRGREIREKIEQRTLAKEAVQGGEKVDVDRRSKKKTQAVSPFP